MYGEGRIAGVIEIFKEASVFVRGLSFSLIKTKASGCRGCYPCSPAETETKTKRKKKITAAIYEYQADCDGEWGEISVDFENGTAEIIRLADWDTIKTNWFANEAIRHILSLSPDALGVQIYARPL